MLRSAVLVAGSLIALAGCGSSSSSSSSSSPQTDLKITAEHGAQPPSAHVVCPGSPACARLEKLTVKDFAPVPPTEACTQIYGGDATAHVEGKLHGATVNADFNLHNGCETARWNKLDFLLGKPPGAGGNPG